MLIFRPAIVERWSGIRIQTETRTTPVTLDSECYHKQVRLKLPAGFTVDEMPDAANLSAPFGKFTSTYKVENRELLFTEHLDVTAATIPAARYGEVKEIFEHVAGADLANVGRAGKARDDDAKRDRAEQISEHGGKQERHDGAGSEHHAAAY